MPNPSFSDLRAHVFARQGFRQVGTAPEGDPRAMAAALDRNGWARSVGGASPYLALRARSGSSRASIDAAVAELALHELPAVRGCTYVVPACDFALALAAARPFAEVPITAAKTHLGVEERELATLADAVLEHCTDGPLDPATLRERCGDRVRSFGEAGRKRGVNSTLPLVLGRLQAAGRLRRHNPDGRLDHQRHTYVRWDLDPLPDAGEDAVALGLARRYWTQALFGTLDSFVRWSGLPVKRARAAAAGLGLRSVPGHEDLSTLPETLDSLGSSSPNEGLATAIGSLDPYIHMRPSAAWFSEFAPAPTAAKGAAFLGQADHHAIVEGGRIVASWAWDTDTATAAVKAHEPLSAGARCAIEAVSAFVRDELGDARTFSLDSPSSRRESLEALRRPA